MLLSVEYKMISGCIARRLGEVIGKLVAPDQTGFIQGRYIGESIRTIYDVMQYAKDKKMTGLLLLVDFSKAFDCLSHSFILKCLDFFGFNTDFKNWIKVLILNFKASTNYVGNISEPFLLGRGSKQGDPVSSLLFLLCVEVLALKLDNIIEGIRIGNFSAKKSLYADDLTCILKYDANELRNVMAALNEFHAISGLKINEGKTQVVVIGVLPCQNYILCNDINLNWSQEFKLLGIHFDSQLANMEINFEKTMDKIRKVIRNWRYRYLTVYGRSIVAKTLLLSKLSNLFLVLPDLSAEHLRKVESEIFSFIWNGTDKVRRTDAVLAEKNGGLNLPNIKQSMDALKIGWFRRGFRNPDAAWVQILNATLKDLNRNLSLDVILTRTSLDTIAALAFANPFWHSCFKKLRPISRQFASIDAIDSALGFILWGSKFTSTSGRTLNRRYYSNIAGNIETIADTVELVGDRLAFIDDARLSAPNNIDLVKLASFRQIIRNILSNYNIHIGNVIDPILIAKPRRPLLIKLITLCEKGCGAWTKIMKNRLSLAGISDRERKWEERFGFRLGVGYWNSCYRMIRLIDFSNRLKWFHFQVVRGCLKVNYVVSKFKPNVSENCTFCIRGVETTMHLLFECRISRAFITESLVFLNQAGINVDFSNMRPYEFLFQQRNRFWNYRSFIILIMIKYFIWISRCKGVNPVLPAFKNWLKKELEILTLCFDQYKKMRFTQDILDLILNE